MQDIAVYESTVEDITDRYKTSQYGTVQFRTYIYSSIEYETTHLYSIVQDIVQIGTRHYSIV